MLSTKKKKLLSKFITMTFLVNSVGAFSPALINYSKADASYAMYDILGPQTDSPKKNEVVTMTKGEFINWVADREASKNFVNDYRGIKVIDENGQTVKEATEKFGSLIPEEKQKAAIQREEKAKNELGGGVTNEQGQTYKEKSESEWAPPISNSQFELWKKVQKEKTTWKKDIDGNYLFTEDEAKRLASEFGISGMENGKLVSATEKEYLIKEKRMKEDPFRAKDNSRILSQEEKDYELIKKFDAMGLSDSKALEKVKLKLAQAEAEAKANGTEVDPVVKSMQNLIKEYEEIKPRISSDKLTMDDIPAKKEKQLIALRTEYKKEKLKAEESCARGDSCELSELGKSYARMLAYLDNQQTNPTTSTAKTTNTTDPVEKKKEEPKTETKIEDKKEDKTEAKPEDKKEDKKEKEYTCPAGATLVQSAMKCCPSDKPYYRIGKDGSQACYATLEESSKTEDQGGGGGGSSALAGLAALAAVFGFGGLGGGHHSDNPDNPTPDQPNQPNQESTPNGTNEGRSTKETPKATNMPFQFVMGYGESPFKLKKVMQKNGIYLIGENTDEKNKEQVLIKVRNNIPGVTNIDVKATSNNVWVYPDKGESNIVQSNVKYKAYEYKKGEYTFSLNHVVALSGSVQNRYLRQARVPGNYVIKVQITYTFENGTQRAVQGYIRYRIEDQETHIDAKSSVEQGYSEVSTLSLEDSQDLFNALGTIQNAEWDSVTNKCMVTTEGTVQSGNDGDDSQVNGTFRVASSNISQSQCNTKNLEGKEYVATGLNQTTDKNGNTVLSDENTTGMSLDKEEVYSTEYSSVAKGEVVATTLENAAGGSVTVRVSPNGDQFLRWDGSPLTENDKQYLRDSMGIDVDTLELRDRGDGQFAAYSGDNKVSKDKTELSEADYSAIATNRQSRRIDKVADGVIQQMLGKKEKYQKSLEEISRGKKISYNNIFDKTGLNNPNKGISVINTTVKTAGKIADQITKAIPNISSVGTTEAPEVLQEKKEKVADKISTEETQVNAQTSTKVTPKQEVSETKEINETKTKSNPPQVTEEKQNEVKEEAKEEKANEEIKEEKQNEDGLQQTNETQPNKDTKETKKETKKEEKKDDSVFGKIVRGIFSLGGIFG